MKSLVKVVALVLLMLISTVLPAGGGGAIRGRVGPGFGSLRNRYPYPVTDVNFRMVLFNGKGLLDARLRAYGLKSLFNGKNYDLAVYAHKAYAVDENLAGYFGAGAELMLRLNGDDRSQATSGVQPLLVFGSMLHEKKFYFNVPIWTRFYGNGISFSILPEPSYKVRDVQFFVRYELSLLALYHGGHEWRHESMLGCYFYF